MPTEFDGEVFVSYAARLDLDAQHKYLEIEIELFGTHYLTHDQPSAEQSG